jgi:hypothetical protein
VFDGLEECEVVTATSVLTGVVVGLTCGWALRRLRASPVAQSILALQLGWMFGGFAAGLISMMRSSQREGILAISVGLSELMVLIFVVAVLGGAIHCILGLVARGKPTLLRNRPVFLGLIGGVCGSLAAARSGLGHALQP